MGALRRYFIPLSKAGPRIISNYLFKFKKYADKQDKYPIKLRYENDRALAIKVANDLRVEVYIEGKENIPNDTVACFVGNHISDFDPVLLVLALDKPTTFIAKEEVRKLPFVSSYLRSLSGEFMNRDDLRQSLKVMSHVESDLKAQNKNWVIFPEGTRNKDDHRLCLEFHHGTFRAPKRAGVPIVPFVIYGTQRVLKSSPVYEKYPLTIKFLKPILKDEYDKLDNHQLAALVRSKVQRALSFEVRKLDHDRMSKINKNYKLF
jgi:1-acyl-sn-glycerol-3-phosphate acyltransferase